MTRKIVFIFLFTILAFSNINAHTRNKLNTCIVNRSYINNYEPKAFQSNNNLLRKTGEEEFFCGQKIYLKLKFVDKNCVPISDARIYIWQVGCDGKYPYETMRKNLDEKLISSGYKSSFVGSGTNITNNLGKVDFLTVRPSNRHKHGFINIRIEHSFYGTYETRLKITNDMVQRTIDETQIVDERIVLPWVNSYRRF